MSEFIFVWMALGAGAAAYSGIMWMACFSSFLGGIFFSDIFRAWLRRRP